MGSDILPIKRGSRKDKFGFYHAMSDRTLAATQVVGGNRQSYDNSLKNDKGMNS